MDKRTIIEAIYLLLIQTVPGIVLYFAIPTGTYSIFYFISAGSIIATNAIILLQEAFVVYRKKIDHIYRINEEIGYPRAAAVIAAYLPNEKDLIFETIEHYTKSLQYPGELKIILAYNTPKPMPKEESTLEALQGQYGPNKRCMAISVPNSKSKAENINHIIGNYLADTDIVGVFDADHHPQIDAFVQAWHTMDERQADVVQGRCVIRNGKLNFLTHLISVEFEMIYGIHHPGQERVFGFGIFGGSNGYWRREVLTHMKMDKSMLTEDIDSSFRALLNGYRVVYNGNIASTELSPETWQLFIKQRLRWSQGWFQVMIKHSGRAFRSEKLTNHQKFGVFLLLIWREVSLYLQSWAIVIFLISVIKFREVYYDTVLIGLGIVSFVMLPLELFLLRFVCHEILRKNDKWLWLMLLFGWAFQILMWNISLLSHFRQFTGYHKWNVTSRGSAPVTGAAIDRQVVSQQAPTVMIDEPTKDVLAVEPTKNAEAGADQPTSNVSSNGDKTTVLTERLPVNA